MKAIPDLDKPDETVQIILKPRPAAEVGDYLGTSGGKAENGTKFKGTQSENNNPSAPGHGTFEVYDIPQRNGVSKTVPYE